MLYLWLILTLPTDRYVCELWTREITQAALVQACGTDTLEKYRVDVTQNGAGVCSVPGASVSTVRQQCGLTSPLDAYRLRVIEPSVQDSLCTVRTTSDTPPAWDEIARQCPDAATHGPGGVEIRFWTTRQPDPEPAPVCKPPATDQPAVIATTTDYHLLAGKLIWYGLAQSACAGGYSGVDPETFAATACGMDGARAKMIDWQNGLDASILAAAREWNVPAALLKKLIADETQFWPWTGTDGEHGLAQITDDGAAVVMHIYQPGYYQMTDRQKQNARSAWLRQMDCLYCTPAAAYEHARNSMTYYAQALAAYYCMYGSWDAALAAWNIKHKEK